MVGFIIRMWNSANKLTQKILFHFLIVIVLRESHKMWEEGSKILLTSPVFLNLIYLLDTSIWPIDDKNLATFGENQILELTKHFNDILLSNSCNIYQVQTEWNRLKNHIGYILENNLKTTYLNIWTKSLPIALS